MHQVELSTFVCASVAAVLCGCGGGNGDGTQSQEGASNPSATWEVRGTLQFPADEVAAGLKLVATTDMNAHSATTYASDPIPLTLSGAPPVATFSLAIDATKLGTLTGPKIFELVIFQDVNGSGVNDFSEGVRQLMPADASSGIWCDGVSCGGGGADFLRILAGTTGTGADGSSYAIATTGWYYTKGCANYSCAHLISTNNALLTGAKLAYSYSENAAIVPQ
jgi:hypothetical protein